MPHLTTDDGIRLYYEETGSATPIVFVHEFADDYRGYEPQIRYFARRYRCIAYNARGLSALRCAGGRRMTRGAIRKTGRATIFAPSSTRSVSRKPISSAFRWAALRHSISA